VVPGATIERLRELGVRIDIGHDRTSIDGPISRSAARVP
jgi:hypothetical protein